MTQFCSCAASYNHIPPPLPYASNKQLHPATHYSLSKLGSHFTHEAPDALHRCLPTLLPLCTDEPCEVQLLCCLVTLQQGYSLQGDTGTR
jgi:hypothetical protein